MELRTEWTGLFKEVFDSLSEPFSAVLNAAGCREGWLQAEFYRRRVGCDPGFVVNDCRIGSRAKADLYGERPSRMVAEIKIYGLWGYLPKNIDGRGHICRYLPQGERNRFCVRQDQIDGALPGSLLKDVFRLQHFEQDIEKYMILVVQKAGEVDEFGKAIQAVRLTQREVTFDYPDFFVRIWQV